MPTILAFNKKSLAGFGNNIMIYFAQLVRMSSIVLG
jgi:hypothetical protein